MKRAILILLVFFILFLSLTSCTKQYSTNPAQTSFGQSVPSAPLPPIPPTTPTPTPTTENVTTPAPTIPQIFNKDITFSYKYSKDEGAIPYGLFIPSGAPTEQPLPLIIWLHGSGEVNRSKETFAKSGFVNVMLNWELEGFSAYVLCPHLSGDKSDENWNTETSRKNLLQLLDKIITEYNIDTSSIIISGHSLGGMGVLYMAYKMPAYFSKAVVMSGFHVWNVDYFKIKIPIIGFVEYTDSSHAFMTEDFVEVFGSDKLFIYTTSHGNIPGTVFRQDRDGNNHSDLIEWMLLEDYVFTK